MLCIRLRSLCSLCYTMFVYIYIYTHMYTYISILAYYMLAAARSMSARPTGAPPPGRSPRAIIGTIHFRFFHKIEERISSVTNHDDLQMAFVQNLDVHLLGQ